MRKYKESERKQRSFLCKALLVEDRSNQRNSIQQLETTFAKLKFSIRSPWTCLYFFIKTMQKQKRPTSIASAAPPPPLLDLARS